MNDTGKSKRVTVFCASTNKCPKEYLELANTLGHSLAKNGFDLVYGGSYVGCMKEVADGARNGGGNVIGVIPKIFFDRNIQDDKCSELVVTNSYRERKAKLCELADIFVALPGGLGTLDELIEVIMLTSIDELRKPIHVIDPWGDFEPLHDLLTNLESKKMIREGKSKLYTVHSSIADFFNKIDQ